MNSTVEPSSETNNIKNIKNRKKKKVDRMSCIGREGTRNVLINTLK